MARRTADVLKDVSELELLQAPGLPYIIPKDYASYPRLTGAGRPGRQVLARTCWTLDPRTAHQRLGQPALALHPCLPGAGTRAIS